MALLSRRALARISRTETLGLSSTKIGASANRPTAWLIWVQSPWLRRPVRTLVESTRASEHRMRWLTSIWLISRLKISTGRLACRATWEAAPSAKEVLCVGIIDSPAR